MAGGRRGGGQHRAPLPPCVYRYIPATALLHPRPRWVDTSLPPTPFFVWSYPPPPPRARLGAALAAAKDLTKNGMKNSAGVMVNYKYELENIVRNHEMYVNEHVIDISDGVLEVLKLEK